MVKLGCRLMAEEHGPAALVRNMVRAEQAGFAFAAISDYFFPWLDEQGHAPFAWSVLGAAAQATRQIQLMTAVTCPIMRYHPAIIARGGDNGSAEREPRIRLTGRRATHARQREYRSTPSRPPRLDCWS